MGLRLRIAAGAVARSWQAVFLPAVRLFFTTMNEAVDVPNEKFSGHAVKVLWHDAFLNNYAWGIEGSGRGLGDTSA